MVELDLFVPFLRTPDGCSALLEVLGTAYAELLNLQSRAEFETAVGSEKFIFHLDTFLRFAWCVSAGLL